MKAFKKDDFVHLKKYYVKPGDFQKFTTFKVIKVLDAQYLVEDSQGNRQFTVESNMRFASALINNRIIELIDEKIKALQDQKDKELENTQVNLIEIANIQGQIQSLIYVRNFL